MKPAPIKNRVTAMTGTDYPIIQAPMGWIARAQLASAVSNAGGLGVIETASGEFDNIRNEVAKMRDLTDQPFGMNVALSYVKGTDIVDFVIKQNIKFVTTSSGSPSICTQAFQEAGIKVFHVVPTLDMALIRSRTDLPIIAAGGMCDGLSMAGAFAMGAEGVQMGTRMLSCADSPVHDNWKQAVVNAKETDTVFLNQQSRPALRALRTERTAELLPLGAFNAMEHLAGIPELYFGGDMEAAIPLSGQVVGRIDEVKSAEAIVHETVSGFYEAVSGLTQAYNQ